ncbi:4Fe-4S ferredoxin [Candidatus Woesearchaeota archaeon CG_4_10_14_0_8_um_filter_47_5]|nr:MAG: 4Fe-4S ferredoxin [Candidatus Woesearchaeota archaeon CG_4_10_14_0_8_um_filter_47_5]
MPKPIINYEKCSVKKTCVEICPVSVFEYDEKENKVTVAHPDACTGCRACESQCPEKAITVVDD